MYPTLVAYLSFGKAAVQVVYGFEACSDLQDREYGRLLGTMPFCFTPKNLSEEIEKFRVISELKVPAMIATFQADLEQRQYSPLF